MYPRGSAGANLLPAGSGLPAIVTTSTAPARRCSSSSPAWQVRQSRPLRLPDAVTTRACWRAAVPARRSGPPPGEREYQPKTREPRRRTGVPEAAGKARLTCPAAWQARTASGQPARWSGADRRLGTRSRGVSHCPEGATDYPVLRLRRGAAMGFSGGSAQHKWCRSRAAESHQGQHAKRGGSMGP